MRSRGFCPCPVVKPSFQVFSLNSKATNKVPSVMLSCTLRVAGVVMGFLLHSDRSRVMEKKLTNSGPLREPADKHSIYTIQLRPGIQCAPAWIARPRDLRRRCDRAKGRSRDADSFVECFVRAVSSFFGSVLCLSEQFTQR